MPIASNAAGNTTLHVLICDYTAANTIEMLSVNLIHKRMIDGLPGDQKGQRPV
jgi:hypothetical protein